MTSRHEDDLIDLFQILVDDLVTKVLSGLQEMHNLHHEGAPLDVLPSVIYELWFSHHFYLIKLIDDEEVLLELVEKGFEQEVPVDLKEFI